MAITHLFASVPVADLAVAVEWYGRLTGRPPDLVPNEVEAAWQLSDTGWLYAIEDFERSGSALVTLLVDDLDAFMAGMRSRGVEAGPIETFGPGVRRVNITDPDGNRIHIGQPPDA